MSGMPCAFAQQRLRSAPVCVLQVFSATPLQPRLPPEFHKLPVVRALIEEERLARGDAAHVEHVVLQLIREGLLHVERARIDLRLVAQQLVEDLIHILRLLHRAVEVRAQPAHAGGEAEPRHAHDALVVPRRVRAAQFDLQAFQAVLLDPVASSTGWPSFGSLPVRSSAVSGSTPPTRCHTGITFGAGRTQVVLHELPTEIDPASRLRLRRIPPGRGSCAPARSSRRCRAPADCRRRHAPRCRTRSGTTSAPRYGIASPPASAFAAATSFISPCFWKS